MPPSTDTIRKTHNVNVVSLAPLVSPRELKAEIPASDRSLQVVIEGRDTIANILAGKDHRLLVVVGPCSIHDTEAALEYAAKLAELRNELEDRLYIVMRVYFEKPRTTVGWKGLINDPDLDGSFKMEKGLRLARQLLADVTDLGLPTATEVLDPATPQYIDDLMSWAAIGARTTESQTHRQMASGLSMPIGFKNSTDGNLQVAIDALKSAQAPHRFLGIDDDGRSCIVTTTGNAAGHVILRGGGGKTNYETSDVAAAAGALVTAGLDPAIMVDCSHANSGKKHEQQEVVWRSIVAQRLAQQDAAHPTLIGAMIESNLQPGNQPISTNKTDLAYGMSITDACIGWDKTEQMLAKAYAELA